MAEIVAVKKSSPVLIAAAWILVVLPALWGLNFTVKNAMKIFAKPGAPISAPASAPASAPVNAPASAPAAAPAK